MMLPSYSNLNYRGIGISFVVHDNSTLNICYGTLAT
jgi:hypothetical protein